MDELSQEELLEQLKSSDEEVRQKATETLWRSWYSQKGLVGLELLRRAQTYLDLGEVKKAEAILTETINTQPDFAEAWNRRAVLYYMLGHYTKSRDDCEQVVKLNSSHFGAWHGLGLCHAALGNYRDAITAFHQALVIQPYAVINQKLILECTARLS